VMRTLPSLGYAPDARNAKCLTTDTMVMVRCYDVHRLFGVPVASTLRDRCLHRYARALVLRIRCQSGCLFVLPVG
jgi:hypothetical protein